MPPAVAEQIIKRVRIEGEKSITAEEVQGMIESSSKVVQERLDGITNLVKEALEFQRNLAASNNRTTANHQFPYPITQRNGESAISSVYDPLTFRDVGSQPMHMWGGRVWNPVPEPILFPRKLKPQDLFHLWYAGDISKMYHPFRFLRACHLKCEPEQSDIDLEIKEKKKSNNNTVTTTNTVINIEEVKTILRERIKGQQKQLLTRASQFMSTIENLILNELKLVQSVDQLRKMNCDEMLNVFEVAYAALLDKISTHVENDNSRKRKMLDRRIVALSYVTVWDDLARYNILIRNK